MDRIDARHWLASLEVGPWEHLFPLFANAAMLRLPWTILLRIRRTRGASVQRHAACLQELLRQGPEDFVVELLEDHASCADLGSGVVFEPGLVLAQV